MERILVATVALRSVASTDEVGGELKPDFAGMLLGFPPSSSSSTPASGLVADGEEEVDCVCVERRDAAVDADVGAVVVLGRATGARGCSRSKQSSHTRTSCSSFIAGTLA